MIRNGKYVYWTKKGWRVESPEPMRDIDLEQIEDYPSWSNQISILEAGKVGKNFFVLSLSKAATTTISSPKTSIERFWPKFTLTE